MAQSNKTGISMVLYVRRYLSYIGMAGVLWLFASPLWAKDSVNAKFKATITQGTCDISASDSNIELGTVQFKDVVSGKINKEAYLTLKNCTAVVNKDSITPTITVTGDHVDTDETLFRNRDKQSPAMGVTVQLKTLNGGEWSSDLKNGVPFHLANKGTIINDHAPSVSVPVKFSLMCAPVVGESAADCKKTGKISATMTFTFDYR
ncbi:fimbrial protein [Photorhabdus temperata]|uniref:P pilus assembly protein, pilin FimA n=1 Tax=Photorhabdus temperata subsp. temperata Meg1 TaxID=1393735 RepID=A0A081S041_PHOTE|nr:fimbrial protein [Photorhabdus temperata]KER04294.1 P pilus assembly protein, pilin FimA [Photorhabdus temperata subsp. temperata Meg1]